MNEGVDFVFRIAGLKAKFELGFLEKKEYEKQFRKLNKKHYGCSGTLVCPMY